MVMVMVIGSIRSIMGIMRSDFPNLTNKLNL